MRQSLQKLNTRILALAMAVILLLCSVPAVSAAEDSGSCGKNLEWSLSGDTLTITGSGAMYDYPESTMAPWYDYRREIARVQLPDGLTRIGNLAFYECSALEFVSLPDSVTEVGWHAFDGCTSMTMLDLGSSLKTIGDGAFRECSALVSVRLPESLTSIGERGFYRCGSLTEITVPASVKKMGNSAFSYCYDLVRADIRAQIKELPAWTFYGCSRLNDVVLPSTLTSVGELAFYDCTELSNVEYKGSEENKEKIDEDIERNLAGERNKPLTVDGNTGSGTGGSQSGESGSGNQSGGSQSGGSGSGNQSGGSQSGGSGSGNQPGGSQSGGSGSGNQSGGSQSGDNNQSTSEMVYEGNNGDLTGSSITTEQTENASISYKLSITYYSGGGSSTSAHVNVTLETGEAWKEVADEVLKTIEQVDSAMMDIYIKDNTTLPSGALDALAGKNVIVTIHNATGSVWKINCSQMGETDGKDSYNLSYERTNATEEQLELLGCAVGYQIRFAFDAQINAEVLIKLPLEHARKHASLYQVKFGGDKELLQTTVVDDAGYAHFYLASVERKTTYLIGIDVQEVAPEEAIIPEVLHQDYGVTEQLSHVEYVVTGRTSSWGMSLNQVTFILAVVMLTVVVIVGCVMYALNKRKLRMGYIPDLDEEDYE